MSKNKTLSAANASAYVYDGIGNLSTSSVATGGLPAVAMSYYANSLNQYQSIWSADGGAWLEHSENGELTRLGYRVFLYDAKSRLVTAGEWVFDEERYLVGDYDDYYDLWSIVGVSNRYDHLDRRVQKVTPATTSSSSTPNSSTRQLYIPFYDAYGNVMGWLSGIPDS